jgi:allophanate hydrolase
MRIFPRLTLASIREALAAGHSLESLVTTWFERVDSRGDDAVWIWRPALEQVLATLPRDPTLPLYGMPFAIKDNIDVRGWPTTAGCPEFAYTAAFDATVVAKLRAAGAIPIGKTNLDQFATGLVGVRSPYGIPRCVHDSEFISGGSSSGSAVAVAAGLCAFSLGTDTAGSGRVPAGFNGIAGLKPTRGRVSTAGVVPACRSLDCVSVFAPDATAAAAILTIIEGHDPADPYSRCTIPPALWPAVPRIGVPRPPQREFFGDQAYADLYADAIARAAALGATITEIDFAPFAQIAEMLYAGPWLAERAAAVGDFIDHAHASLDPTVASIIRGAAKWTARDAFTAAHRLETLRVQAVQTWNDIDALLLPTTPTHYRVSSVLADPVASNSRLGIYTNFTNLLDLCAIAVPAGTIPGSSRPFGVTFMAPAWQDYPLVTVAQQFLAGQPLVPPLPTECISLAVAGAHLSGQPLHHQLVARHARLLRQTRTAPDYRLFALPNTTPPKPGLVREPGFRGPGIEIEVYALGPREFAHFVADVPAPMTIGTVELADGSDVKCFLCEPFALEGAQELTRFGGWRQWRLSRP